MEHAIQQAGPIFLEPDGYGSIDCNIDDHPVRAIPRKGDIDDESIALRQAHDLFNHPMIMFIHR
jgi:hypothetical protein